MQKARPELGGRRWGLWVATLAGLSAALAAPSLVHAQTLAESRAHYLSAEFEEAIAGFEGALASTALTPSDAVEAHRYLSALRELLGDSLAAASHAAAALALDPAAAPPEGAAEGVSAHFDAAREQLRGQRARLRVEAPEGLAAGSTARVVATLEPSPERLVGQLSLRCASGAEVAAGEGPPPTIGVEIAVAGEVTCRAEARTAAGAVLVSTGEAIAPTEALSVEAPAVAAASDDSWVGVVIGVVVGLAVLGAGAAVLGWYFTQPQGESATLQGPTVVGW